MKEFKKTLTESPTCPCCGASMTEFKQSLSQGLVRSLEKFALVARMKWQTDLHLIKDVELDTNAYNNFQKLRYFDLVEKTGKHGIWSLTQKGLDFIAGRVPVEKSVITFRNKALRKSNEKVWVHELIKDSTQDYWQKEFPIQIVASKVVPVTSADIQPRLL